jgi:hypothetical protein
MYETAVTSHRHTRTRLSGQFVNLTLKKRLSPRSSRHPRSIFCGPNGTRPPLKLRCKTRPSRISLITLFLLRRSLAGLNSLRYNMLITPFLALFCQNPVITIHAQPSTSQSQPDRPQQTRLHERCNRHPRTVPMNLIIEMER